MLHTDSLSGDVECGAVDGLEHRWVLACGIQVASRGNADGACQGGSEIREDVCVLLDLLVREYT
jgi:hypothetical protein